MPFVLFFWKPSLILTSMEIEYIKVTYVNNFLGSHYLFNVFLQN